MTNQLQNFINELLDHEYTKIQVNKDGLSVMNIDLNYHLKIFSDKFNGFYFELSSNTISFESNKIFPTYRTENVQEATSIIDQLIGYIDTSKLHSIKDTPKYIGLFRKILKGESLPKEYNVSDNYDFIELFEPSTKFTFKLPKYHFKNVRTFLQENHEPTAIFKLHINLQKGTMIESNQNPANIIVYIPRYSIKDYSLLNSEPALKNHTELTESLSSWFDNLNNLKSIQDSGAAKLVEYYAITEGLPNQNNKNKKHKL